MADSNLEQIVSNLQLEIDRILKDGQLLRQDYLRLVTIFLSDHLVSEEERSQLNRVFDSIQVGKIVIVD